ncbi:hypothetical protein KJ996_04220 [Patescibacteria group bacterium]|nr:hypothetical protein [Patescibacteria group bacterium]
MSRSAALFSDSVGISAGPNLHDILKSLEDVRKVQFTVNGRECNFRIVGLEIAQSPDDLTEGEPPQEWVIKAALFIDDRFERTYQGFYNVHTRKGTFERPQSLC